MKTERVFLMKLRFAVVLLASLLLVSCGRGAEVSETSGVGRYTEIEGRVETESVEVTYQALYSRTDGYIEKKTYPYITLLNTRSELEKYTADHEGLYDFYENYSSEGFYDIVTPYDAVFFADNSLIMILLEEGSGSIRHAVSGVEYENGETTITITRIVPEVCTDDMAEWHVVVEIPKDSPVLEHPENIKVKFENVQE